MHGGHTTQKPQHLPNFGLVGPKNWRFAAKAKPACEKLNNSVHRISLNSWSYRINFGGGYQRSIVLGLGLFQISGSVEIH
jgi:hypothetical protein